MMKFIDI